MKWIIKALCFTVCIVLNFSGGYVNYTALSTYVLYKIYR